ncbi:MAG: hypothetical protein COY40_05460 [Alphaproteobacteria bacterium CG_4_10_14_0_8_um_filter_53_9]|nr:MAG: hypothetical protein COY40_05460 [Alphaproteobacteria bacterium CG_4_10_14_0_8_um_filter_53_9]
MEAILHLVAMPEAWVALVMLIVMEIVLGIDNLIFLSVLTNKLPPKHRKKARALGLALALMMRLVLLAMIAWIVHLVEPVFSVFGHDVSYRDLILLAGGGFLLWKATDEIHHALEPAVTEGGIKNVVVASLGAAVVQIVVLDLVFSIDSIITAVGMTDHLPIMIIAVMVAMAVMLWASSPLADFIEQHPSVVMLALGFLLMIGMALVAEGVGYHIPRGYLYVAMAFSGFVEALNIMRQKRQG